MNPVAQSVMTIGVSGLLSLITFLFAAWIKGQSEAAEARMKERMLELELRLAREYVEKSSLDAHLAELKKMIADMSSSLRELQRIVDRRFHERRDEDQA